MSDKYFKGSQAICKELECAIAKLRDVQTFEEDDLRQVMEKMEHELEDLKSVNHTLVEDKKKAEYLEVMNRNLHQKLDNAREGKEAMSLRIKELENEIKDLKVVNRILLEDKTKADSDIKDLQKKLHTASDIEKKSRLEIVEKIESIKVQIMMVTPISTTEAPSSSPGNTHILRRSNPIDVSQIDGEGEEMKHCCKDDAIPPSTSKLKRKFGSVNAISESAMKGMVLMEYDTPQLRNLATYLDKAVFYEAKTTLTVKVLVEQSMRIVGHIKERLNEHELQLFRRSCFGHFLDLDPSWTNSHNTFAGQLAHFLMRRLIVTPNVEEVEEIWFDIEGKPIRFSLREFAMVTGLKCSKLSEFSLPEDNQIREKYFSGSKCINQADVRMKFESMTNEGNGEKEDRVKVALIYFLYGVILGGYGKKNIPDKYFKMINDWDMFNAYPWGREAYKVTINSIYRQKLPWKCGKKIKKQRPFSKTYTLLGFPFALQVWALESIPALNGLCGHKIDTNRLPRFLNWKYRAMPAQQQIIAAENGVVYDILEASMDEKAMPYMINITDYEDDMVTEV